MSAVAKESVPALLWRLWRDPAAWIETTDIFIGLVAVTLPWSTSLVAIFAVAALVTMLPFFDAGAFLQSLKRPVCTVPLALFGSHSRLRRVGRCYGSSAVFATAGSWRWKMLFEHTDTTHSTFWSQLLRWLVSETPGQVTASTPRQVLSDETKVHFQVDARNKDYEPVSNAEVEAHVLGPAGSSEISQTPRVARPSSRHQGSRHADRGIL